MAEINAQRDIPAAPEKVWAVLADPTRYEEWMTMHTKWKAAPPAELSQGSTMTEVLTIMGMPNTIEWTVENYDAPNTLKISGEGMAGAQVSFTLSVGGSGEKAEVTIDAVFKSNMMVGAIGKAVERNGRKELDASLDKLSALVS